uniref:AB hydrolase-1 domain-containing protein n=1 Tax=Elaeophora elaphi TaxID=1147741 RepID=A0A0R3S3U3_9BILA
MAMDSIMAFLELLLNWISLTDLWSNYVWFGAFVLIVALIRFLNVLSYPEKPEITYMQKTALGKNRISIGDMLDRCPILKEVYSPPLLWGRSGHLQTASYGLFGHASLIRTYDCRHVVKLSDGASVVFDVFEPVKLHRSGKDLTLALCPGIANTSESNYIRTCVHYAQENGFRCAVLNHLGALKHIPLTSNRIFSYGGTEEMEEMMARLYDLYPSTRFFCIGFSMGGNITTRMIAKFSSGDFQHRIIAGLSVAQGYCATTSLPLYHNWENGRRAYNYLITENMKRLLRRNYDMAVAPHVKTGLIDEQHLWAATSIMALDDSYTRRILGYENVEEFYRDISSLSVIPKIKIPMIFVNALDDPLIPPCLWHPVRKLAATNEYFGFVLTKHGGHLGFLEGSGIAPNSVTWLDRFIVELANSIVIAYDESE